MYDTYFTYLLFSQGSVATRMRCAEIFTDHIITRLLLSTLVGEFCESVNIWQSFGQE